jgi:predicted dehydrogenase
VVIATPHCQHADQILDSFEARCHVLTEKPLVTAVTDAERVIAARDASGKVGLVSYQRHYQPEFRAIRQIISSGRAGPVRYISALLSQEWLRGTSGTWRQQLSLSGGGFLNDSGSHLIDIILWSTGLRPNSVAALCDRRGTEVDINSTVSAVFDGGATATFSFIGDGMSWHEEITIWCEDLAFFIREGKLKTVDRSGVSSSPPLEDGSMTPDQNFIDCILGRAECESPFEGGLEVARFTDAIYRSSDAGGIPVLVASGAALVL